jgi:transposase
MIEERVPGSERRRIQGEKASAEKVARGIRRKTRRRFSAEEKIRIVIGELRGEESIPSVS